MMVSAYASITIACSGWMSALDGDAVEVSDCTATPPDKNAEQNHAHRLRRGFRNAPPAVLWDCVLQSCRVLEKLSFSLTALLSVPLQRGAAVVWLRAACHHRRE